MLIMLLKLAAMIHMHQTAGIFRQHIHHRVQKMRQEKSRHAQSTEQAEAAEEVQKSVLHDLPMLRCALVRCQDARLRRLLFFHAAAVYCGAWKNSVFVPQRIARWWM